MLKKIIKEIKKDLESTQIIDWALGELKNNIRESDLQYSHSLRVALILKRIQASPINIACGILYYIPTDKISKKNQQVIGLLEKTKQLKNVFDSKNELAKKPIAKCQDIVLNSQAENLRKMFFALSRDLEPAFVILAIILDEMRNIDSFPQQERLRKSLDALEVFAPLAYSIGITTIKGELEDLAFPQIYPKEYNWLKKKIKEKHEKRECLLAETQPLIRQSLEKDYINVVDIHSRTKHLFSLYRKLLRYDMDLEKIYDLIAMRIIVPDIQSCYKALGAIHKDFKPVTGRIKDYIATPKRNGYRSLHTTVICPKHHELIEIQIRTPQMHQEAEYGVAYHLGHKQNLLGQNYWMLQIKKWQEEIKKETSLGDYFKNKLFKDRIFVLTPKREIIDLPKESTPIDFAYAVHTEIGEHCEGAKVNGKMVSLKKYLETGDLVEIITNKNKVPSSDWLRFIKTNKAKNRVKTFLEKTSGIAFKKANLGPVIRKPISLLKKIIPKKHKTPQIYIAGQSGISVKISKCCNPQPQDKVLAFITKGKGASLHKKDCNNLQHLKEKSPERIVQATWQKD